MDKHEIEMKLKRQPTDKVMNPILDDLGKLITAYLAEKDIEIGQNFYFGLSVVTETGKNSYITNLPRSVAIETMRNMLRNLETSKPAGH